MYSALFGSLSQGQRFTPGRRGTGSAPNLETVIFERVRNDIIAQLGSRLFARGALAAISTLKFWEVTFDKQSMTDLMNGFRRSGHAGGALQTLIFDNCNAGPFSTINAGTKGASLALIAGLSDGTFPNLQELLTPRGALLVREMTKLVKVLR